MLPLQGVKLAEAHLLLLGRQLLRAAPAAQGAKVASAGAPRGAAHAVLRVTLQAEAAAKGAAAAARQAAGLTQVELGAKALQNSRNSPGIHSAP